MTYTWKTCRCDLYLDDHTVSRDWYFILDAAGAPVSGPYREVMANEIAETHNKTVEALITMTHPGMEITIAVRCQRCDDSYLNTLGKTPEHARELAESVGWQIAPELGWVCPQCGDV